MKAVDWAYYAGLFDGEGHITLSKRYSRRDGRFSYCRSIGITNTNKPVLDKLASQLYGCIYINNHKRKKRQRTAYVWVAYGETMRIFLKGVLPYLKIKKGQAEVLLTTPCSNRRGRRGYSVDEIYDIEQAIGRIRRMKNTYQGRQPKYPTAWEQERNRRGGNGMTTNLLNQRSVD